MGAKKSNIVRVKVAPGERLPTKTDWKRVDALTDEQIEQAIKDDPDAAPIADDEWFRTATWLYPDSKVLISLRLDREVIDWFKSGGAR